MKKSISAVILAGGKSRRMGANKAFLEWKGMRFIERLQETLAACFDTVCISGAKALYASYNEHCIEDVYGNIGPLGALASVFDALDSDWIFVVSCDTPTIEVDLLDKLLLELDETADAVLCKANGRLMPLVGVYHRRSLAVMKEKIEMKSYRMMDFLNEINYKELLLDTQQERQVQNINTAEDFKELLSRQIP